MAFCVKCGAQIADDAKFCPNCGEKVAVAPPVVKEPDREALLPAVSSANDVCQEIYKMECKKDAFNQKKKRILSMLPSELFVFVGICIIGILLLCGWSHELKILKSDGTFIGWFKNAFKEIQVSFPFILVGVIDFVLGVIFYRRYQSAEKKRRAKAAEMDAQMKQVDDDIDLYYAKNYDIIKVLPPDYRYALASDYILSTLRNRRADTIKEATNLFEDQLHKWRMERYQVEILNRQQAMNDHLAVLDVAAILLSIR